MILKAGENRLFYTHIKKLYTGRYFHHFTSLFLQQYSTNEFNGSSAFRPDRSLGLFAHYHISIQRFKSSLSILSNNYLNEYAKRFTAI